jgi:MraZ protein
MGIARATVILTDEAATGCAPASDIPKSLRQFRSTILGGRLLYDRARSVYWWWVVGQSGKKWENRPVLLTGTHPRTVDDKKRLTLPKRVREQLGDVNGLFVTPGPDQSLWLYTRPELERLAGKLDEAPATDAEARTFRRLFFAQMEEVEIDRTGRILLAERLVAFAGLQHEVILLGVRDHLELWDAGRWQEFMNQHGPRFDAVAEGAFRNAAPHSSGERGK